MPDITARLACSMRNTHALVAFVALCICRAASAANVAVAKSTGPVDLTSGSGVTRSEWLLLGMGVLLTLGVVVFLAIVLLGKDPAAELENAGGDGDSLEPPA